MRKNKNIDYAKILIIVFAFLLLIFSAYSTWLQYQTDLGIEFNPALFLRKFVEAVGPEAAGIALTVLVLDFLHERREDIQRKKRLILQMKSSDNGFVRDAVNELRGRNWYKDGTLNNASLFNSNLAGANLFDAVMKNADLSSANLKNCYAPRADFSHANIRGADLTEAMLRKANLQYCDLTGALLVNADLSKANLSNAIVAHSALITAKKLDEAIMPDGQLYEVWIAQSPQTDNLRAMEDANSANHEVVVSSSTLFVAGLGTLISSILLFYWLRSKD